MKNHQQIVLYSSDGCHSCYRVKEFLHRHGIGYEEKNIARNPQFIEELHSLGSTVVPTLVFSDQLIVGFRPNLLKRVIEDTD